MYKPEGTCAAELKENSAKGKKAVLSETEDPQPPQGNQVAIMLLERGLV